MQQVVVRVRRGGSPPIRASDRDTSAVPEQRRAPDRRTPDPDEPDHGGPGADEADHGGPGRGDGASAALAVVLGYLGTEGSEAACVRLTLAPGAVGGAGTARDPT
ncbi:MAG: hypothetical protein QOG76_6494, partial [Pseudonocardiales bacterium]|nr:hypothetical protein [Pseudonocardiales bacterium]